jgi:hypothetical protein
MLFPGFKMVLRRMRIPALWVSPQLGMTIMRQRSDITLPKRQRPKMCTSYSAPHSTCSDHHLAAEGLNPFPRTRYCAVDLQVPMLRGCRRTVPQRLRSTLSATIKSSKGSQAIVSRPGFFFITTVSTRTDFVRCRDEARSSRNLPRTVQDHAEDWQSSSIHDGLQSSQRSTCLGASLALDTSTQAGMGVRWLRDERLDWGLQHRCQYQSRHGSGNARATSIPRRTGHAPNGMWEARRVRPGSMRQKCEYRSLPVRYRKLTHSGSEPRQVRHRFWSLV